jgi:DNA-dependent RNA polymerase auxiliary subunit epsilon
VIANGQVVVADYIEDYFGNIGFYQNDNDALPITFLFDEKTPIYIEVRTKSAGSRVCVIERAYSVDYDEL